MVERSHASRATRRRASPDDLARALAELRDANERLVSTGVRMQELAEEAEDARELAEVASRAKDDFLATLSHELRTPLNAIIGWTHLLRHTRLAGSEAEHALDVIDRNAKLQAQLIADLLQLSQIASGKLQLNTATIDLAPIVGAILDSVRPAAAEKSIALECRIESGVSPVLADSTRVQQVVSNVLANAIKFTPGGGDIQVTLRNNLGVMEVVVEDSGIGIAAEFLPHVFERFRQASLASPRGFGGLGLGLAIVWQLMELHGGYVQAESAGAGRGSTFTLGFPAAMAAAAVRDAEDDLLLNLSGIRVVVVEDEPDSRDLLATLLERRGAVVALAGCAAEAIALLPVALPDVIVSDIGLPDEDGCQMMEHIRSATPPLSDVPAIALSAYALVQDRERALAAGFQVHLSKPLDPVEVVAAVARLGRVQARGMAPIVAPRANDR